MNNGYPPDGFPPGGARGGYDPRYPAEQGPFLVPTGLPPGATYEHEERPPEGVYYFRIFAVFVAILGMIAILAGLISMFTPLVAGSSTTGSAAIGTWVTGLFASGFGALACVPAMIALFGGRKPWVHTLGTVLLGLTMTQVCCLLPILIPLLIVWLKPETRRWYGHAN